jgi:hypothetical protein
MKKYKLILKSVKKLKSGKKKYEAIFIKKFTDGKDKEIKRKFGAAGMSDFTIHKDIERRDRYIKRHKKDLKTNDPTRAGFLSMYILWNKKTHKASVSDFKRRLNIYNKTGKFPKSISGSSLKSRYGDSTISSNNKFGVKLPDFTSKELNKTYINMLPPEIKEKIKEYLAAYMINKNINLNKLSILRYRQSPIYLKRLLNKYKILDPRTDNTRLWLFQAADILTSDNLKEPYWYEVIRSLVGTFLFLDPEKYTGQIAVNINICEENLEIILEKMGFNINENLNSQGKWYFNAWKFLNSNEEITSFGKSKIPDNVKNKALYKRIKAKIRREVNKKGRRWGAYDSGRLVREYKSKGGKYSGKKGKTKSKGKEKMSALDRWYKEKWVDACAWPKRKSCGRTKSKEKIAYCRPSVKVSSKTPKLIQELSKSQIKSRCRKKKRSPKKRIR